MRRRELIFGALGSIIYIACGSGDDDASSDTPPGEKNPSPDGGDLSEAGLSVPSTSPAEESHKVFPQGLASGDPRPDRVVLWTRVEPTSIAKTEAENIDIELIIAKDEALTQIVARQRVSALASADHTVRIVPTGLEAGRFYYYRFGLVEAAGASINATTTQVGRTKTAPDPNADVPVRFAMCACEDFIGRYWHAWRALLEETAAKGGSGTGAPAAKDDLDFILYLGDYIYESVNDNRFQSTTPDRAITLPDGMDTSPKQDKSRIAAVTLADYRTLYKTYRKDPLLREVHRRYPFIITWDDHEYADDCWQDHSTSFNGQDPANPGNPLPGDEKNTPRRTAANRSFFEYQPLDVVYKSNLTFPFDIQIYRQFRYGKHVDLFMTDQRSYRADHLIPEGQGADLSVGKFIDYSMIGARYFVRKAGFDPKEASAKPSLLGATQKAWFLDAVKKSTATWKVWGNEVQVYQMALDLWRLPGVPDTIPIINISPYTVYLNTDQWDGFRSERAEILDALSKANVQNLLVCTGDIHSFYAAELHVNFDSPTNASSKPVGVEYVTAGISSASLKELMAKFVDPSSPLRFVVDAWTAAADQVLKDSNPHLRYADTDAYGFALMSIDGAKTEATFVQVGSPKDPNYVGIKARQRFVTYVGTNKVTAV